MREHVVDHHQLPDAVLVDLICAGDQQAFETLVQRYQDRLYRFICTFLGREEAHDVLQFVWTQLYLSLPKLKSEQASMRRASQESLKTWLFQVARNRCIDELRKQKRKAILFSEIELNDEEDDRSPLALLPDPSPQPEECVERVEEKLRCHRAIQNLPANFRSVVWLRYVKELTYEEIAQQLHIPSSTAKTMCLRGRRHLRQSLAG